MKARAEEKNKHRGDFLMVFIVGLGVFS